MRTIHHIPSARTLDKRVLDKRVLENHSSRGCVALYPALLIVDHRFLIGPQSVDKLGCPRTTRAERQ